MFGYRGLGAAALPGTHRSAIVGAPMISGECRVESTPFPASPGGDCKLSIQGLRLRLDLRILPGSAGGDAAAAAVWRVESANVAWLPLGGLRGWRAVALAAGLVMLGLALVVWGGHLTSSGEVSREVSSPEPRPRPSPSVPKLPASSAPGATSLPAASTRSAPPVDASAADAAESREATPTRELAGPVAPRISVVDAVAARRPENGATRGSTGAPVRSPTALASTPPPARNAAALGATSARASAHVANEPSRKPDSPRAEPLGSDDMLDLFADTK